MVWPLGGGGHKASVSDCLPLAAPIGLSPLLIRTLCGPERVLVVSTEPLDDLCDYSRVGCPGDGLLPVPWGGGGGGGTRPWWLALLACGGAYWPLALEHSAMLGFSKRWPLEMDLCIVIDKPPPSLSLCLTMPR